MDYNLEDIECGRYQLVFASAENVLVNLFLSSIVNDTASQYRLRSNGRKIVTLINGSCTHGFSLGKYRVQQISAHSSRGGGLSNAFFSRLRNKSASLFHSTDLRAFVL